MPTPKRKADAKQPVKSTPSRAHNTDLRAPRSRRRKSDSKRPRRARPTVTDFNSLLALIDQMPGVVWSTDANLRITNIHGGILTPLGESERHYLGRPIDALLQSAEQSDSAPADAHRQALAGQTVHFLHCSPRSLVDLDVRVSPLRDSAGKIVGCLGLGLDITQQTQARAAAAEWKSRYEAVIRASGHVLYEIRHDTRTMTYGGQVHNVLGLWPNELGTTPEDWARRIHPDDRKARDEEVARVAQTKFPFQLNYRVRHGNGTYIHVEDRGAFFLDRRGHLASMVGFIVDVTPQVRARNALRKASDELGRRVEERTLSLTESEARFRLLAENSTDMIARHDTRGVFLYASPASGALLGCKPEELLGRTCFDLALPEDHPVILKAHNALLETQLPQTITFRVRHRDGSVRWLETIARCVIDPQTRQVLELHCSSRDVSKRLRAQQALHLVQAAVDNVNDAVIITTPQIDLPGPQIVYVNAAFSRMTGYTPDQVMGKTPRILHGPKTQRQFLDTIRGCLERGVHFRGRTVNYRKDGGEFLVDLNIAPVRDDTGNVVNFVAIQRDITEEQQTQEQALRHQAQLAHVARLSTMGEMASGLAHELNQPLAAINNYARGCLRRLEVKRTATPAIIHAMEAVAAQAERAGQIIHRLRNFVSKREPIRVPSDLNDIAREAAALVHAEAAQFGVTLKLELTGAPLPILADNIQIEQVVLNLIRNGMEAMAHLAPADRRLHIRTEARDGQATLLVLDRGHGVPHDFRQQIFDAFFTTKPQGMGMGLSISRSIMQAHDGQVWHDDPPPHGQPGATFRIHLPKRA